MRKLFVVLCLVCSLFLSCTSVPPTNEDDLQYEVVVEFEDKTASDLYEFANAWAVKAFVDSSEAIDFNSAESCTIRGKCVFKIDLIGLYVGINPPYYASCAFSIETKDEKIRFIFDLQHVSEVNSFGFEELRDVTQKDLDSFDYYGQCQEIVDDFVAYTQETKSDW